MLTGLPMPVPMLRRQAVGRTGPKTVKISFHSLNSISSTYWPLSREDRTYQPTGLLACRPPSRNVTLSIIIGLKYVGAADVARAACQIFTPGNTFISRGFLYERKRLALVGRHRALVVVTKLCADDSYKLRVIIRDQAECWYSHLAVIATISMIQQ
jgi:hypothetical protein